MRRILNYFFPVGLLLFSIFAGFLIHNAADFVNDGHFTKLAVSFSKNDLFLSPYNLPDGDFVDFQAKQYLYFGPLPSIMLIPFVMLFGPNFSQFLLSIFSLILTYFVIYKLCMKFKFSRSDSLWLANFFVFGTVLYFVGLVNISAYVVQAIAMPLIVLSLYEYFTKKRWLLIGLLVAAAVATRVTLIAFSVFYLYEILKDYKKGDFKKSLSLFLLPLILVSGLLAVYNFKRFNTFFDTGYTKNITALINTSSNSKYGFFSFSHVSGNLYSLFLMGPNPIKEEDAEFVLKFPYLKADGFGLAIWYTSPLFVYLIKSKRESYTIGAVFAVIALLLPSLFYFGIGSSQYGYRYSLDFIPLLFVVLLSAFRGRLPLFGKILIFGGILFNCFYMLSIWNSYPLFFWLR